MRPARGCAIDRGAGDYKIEGRSLIETEHVPLPKLAVQSPQPLPGQDTAAGVDGSESATIEYVEVSRHAIGYNLEPELS